MERLSPAVAAGVAALAGNAVDPTFSSSFFVIWLFLRAVRTLDVVPSHPALAPLVMVAAVEVIVPGGFNNPEEMHPTYQRFLESFSVGVDVEKMRNPGASNAIGDVVHHFPTDAKFMFQHVYPALALASCQVYWPLHAASSAANWFAWRRKTDGVATSLDSLAENILRSVGPVTFASCSKRSLVVDGLFDRLGRDNVVGGDDALAVSPGDDGQRQRASPPHDDVGLARRTVGPAGEAGKASRTGKTDWP